MAPPSKRKRISSAANIKGETQAETSFHNATIDPDFTDIPPAPQAECPFTVEYRNHGGPGSKKKRRKANGPATPQAQAGDSTTDMTEEETLYVIKPKAKWESLRKYRNFVVGNENFALNEYIFVNHSNLPHGLDLTNTDERKFWVARVLEIRAIDEAHVYLRVYWLYWPEELPNGRQDYHGEKELVASNHMEIVDAMTVSGRANVKHWLELDDEEELPDLFWRQKFDFPKQQLMKVREHCYCHKFYNPDKMMLGCPHCSIWLHEECIIDDVKLKQFAKYKAGGDNATSSKGAADTVQVKEDAGAGEPSAVIPVVNAVSSPAQPRKGAKKGRSGKKGDVHHVNEKTREASEIFDVTVITDENEDSRVRIVNKKLSEDDPNRTLEESITCMSCHKKLS